MMANRSLAILIAVATCFPTGCKKPPPPLVEAEGTVLLNGDPLPRADLMLIPTFKGYGSELMAAATTDDQGRFKLECGVGKGACVGLYKATISEAAAPPELLRYTPQAGAKLGKYYSGLPNRPIPDRYSDPMKTPVEIEIRPDRTTYELTLKR